MQICAWLTIPPPRNARICESERPHLDLLLTDVIMPGMKILTRTIREVLDA